jgi:hypothetical protein
MHVGGGCAASAFNFACLVGNDDATTGTCPMNTRASTITLTGASRSEYVVMVANYYAVGSGSYGSGNFGLNWTYVEPSEWRGPSARVRGRRRRAEGPAGAVPRQRRLTE